MIVGTGALAELEPGHEELKSRRTDPAWRGRGVARWLRGFMLADARGRSVRRVSLETGSADFFAPARAVRLGRLRDLRSLRLLRRGCAGACAAVFVVPILAAGFGWGNWFRGPWVWGGGHRPGAAVRAASTATSPQIVATVTTPRPALITCWRRRAAARNCSTTSS